MTGKEALEEIRENARWGRMYVTIHARKRMKERSVFEDDLFEVLDTAKTCTGQENGAWRVEGYDMDGDELTLIVAIEEKNIIITIY